MFKYIIFLLLLNSCSELLLLSSGAGVVASQSVYAKAYNGVDMMTIVTTKKDIKGNVYETFKKNKKENKTKEEKKDSEKSIKVNVEWRVAQGI